MAQRVELEKNEFRPDYSLSVHHLTLTEDGRFVDLFTGEDKAEVAARYSRMKFGDVNEVQRFGKEIADKLIAEIDDLENPLRGILERAGNLYEFVTMVIPGSRNVDSVSTFLYEEVVQRVNVALTLRGLPTIVLVKFGSLLANVENYALLPEALRVEYMKRPTDMLPGKDYFVNPIHMIFGDDIYITGTASRKIGESSVANGALSYTTLFAISIDPEVAKVFPQVEMRINTCGMSGKLDDAVAEIVNDRRFRPVQRMVRLFLTPENREELPLYLGRMVSDDALLKLYRAAMGNDYFCTSKYVDSVKLVMAEVIRRGLADENGLLI